MNQGERKYSEESSEEEELEFLEESIIFAWENNQQEFVVAIEQFLDDFMKDKERNEELIGNVNKFQRKVIHQLCDRYNILRTYVDVKSNDNANITIQKTDSSEIPEYTVKELYERHLKRARRQQKKTIQQNGGQYNNMMQQQQMLQQQMMAMQQQMMNGQHVDPMMMQMLMMQQQMMSQQVIQPRHDNLSQLNKQNQNLARNYQQQSQLKSQAQAKKQVNLNQIIDQEDEFPALS